MHNYYVVFTYTFRRTPSHVIWVLNPVPIENKGQRLGSCPPTIILLGLPRLERRKNEEK